MMYIEEFRAAAAARFNTQFTSAFPTTKIKWDNLPFEQPDGEIYASFSVVEATGREAEIGTGTKTERYTGMLRIGIHIPKDQGTRAGNQQIQVATRIFFRKSLLGVNWTAKFTRGIRTREVASGEWCVYMIDINYERDERNSA